MQSSPLSPTKTTIVPPTTPQLTAAYSLSHSKLIRWYGLRTLASSNGFFQTPEFLNKWESSLPAAIQTSSPSLDLLRGNYYHPTPTTIQSLPTSELSTVPEQRFAQLFSAKEKWGMEEIMPFLEGCVESGPGWEKRAEQQCQKWARVKSGTVSKR